MQQCAASVLTQFYPKQLGAFAVVTLDTDAKTIWKGPCECNRGAGVLALVSVNQFFPGSSLSVTVLLKTI